MGRGYCLIRWVCHLARDSLRLSLTLSCLRGIRCKQVCISASVLSTFRTPPPSHRRGGPLSLPFGETSVAADCARVQRDLLFWAMALRDCSVNAPQKRGPLPN